MVRAFLPFFERIRRKYNKKVKSKARIPLPFVVESRFEEYTLNFMSKERVRYLVLKAPAQQMQENSSEPIPFIDLE